MSSGETHHLRDNPALTESRQEPWYQTTHSIDVSSDPPIHLQLKITSQGDDVFLFGVMTLPDGSQYAFRDAPSFKEEQ